MTVIRDSLIAGSKWVGALVLGGAFVWQVYELAGPQGEAIVHVTEPDVDVAIDRSHYHIQGLRSAPLVLRLPPGSHTVRMSRGGRVLYEESFTLRSGNDAILTARDQTDHKAGFPIHAARSR